MIDPLPRPAERLQAALGALGDAARRGPRLTLLAAALLTLAAVWNAASLFGKLPPTGDAQPLHQVVVPQDLVVALPLGLLALLLYARLWLGRWRAALLLLVPQLVTLAWTLGLVAQALGQWTPLTGLGLCLVLGFSAQHGGLLLDRFRVELARGRAPLEAVHLVSASAGLGATLSTLMAMLWFLALALSAEPELRDVGVVTGAGLAVSLLTHAALLPALLGLDLADAAAIAAPAPPPARAYATQIRRWAPALFWLSLLGAFAAAWSAPWTHLSLALPGDPPSVAVAAFRVQGPLRFMPALVLGLLTLWWLLRDLRASVTCLVPPAVSLCALAALVPALGRDFAGMQLAMVPLVGAAALTGGLQWTLAANAPQPLEPTLAGTGRRVLWSLGPPALGLVGLLATADPALGGTVLLGLAGLGVNVLASLVTLPAVLALLAFRPGGTPGAAPEPMLCVWRREGFATVGLAGYAPVAPGTFGALVALPVAAVVAPLVLPARLGVALALTGLSVWAAEAYIRQTDDPDPRHVVVDEFAGCLLALVCVPWQPVWVTVAFLLFRLFDVWKPGLVGVAERRLSGGWGIVGDDFVAGVMAGGLAAGLRHVTEGLGWL